VAVRNIGDFVEVAVDSLEGVHKVANFIWDTNTLTWVRMTPSTGGGGGGGATTIANGDDYNAGSTTDAAVVTDANGTISAKLRGLVKMAAEGSFGVTVTNLPGVQEVEAAVRCTRLHQATTTVAYVGTADAGTSTAAPLWRIKRVTTDASGNVTEEYADGNPAFDNVWQDRATLSYS
jgi:hypothetical protein